jgi:hypothetical protein
LFSFAGLLLEDLAQDYDRQTVEATTCTRSTVTATVKIRPMISSSQYPEYLDKYVFHFLGRDCVLIRGLFVVTARPLSDDTVKGKLIN